MTFLFDLPLVVMGPAILVILVGLSLAGLVLFRRRILPRLRFGESDAHFSTAMVSSIMVFYGLALALIAVHVWEIYENVAQITSSEASRVAALYRDVSGYPEPARTRLRNGLRDYVVYLTHEGWAAQRRGQFIGGGVWRMDLVQSTLMEFEPKTEAQKLLAGESLRAYNLMIEARRLRLDATDTHLPGVMWLVILLGAVISMISAYFFPVLDLRVHAAQVALLATFISVVIFMVMALDRPFRGDLGLPATPYQIIYDQLMKR